MRNILFSLLLILGVSNTFACNYTLNLSDSYGDGWNGCSLTVLVNGTSQGNVTIDDGY